MIFYKQIKKKKGALSVTVIDVGNENCVQVQILNKCVCISFRANALGKGMSQLFLLEAIGEEKGFFSLG